MGEPSVRKRTNTPSSEEAAPSPSSVRSESLASNHATPSDRQNGTALSRLLAWLWLPEDASYAGVFRIGWGSIMMWEMWLYIRNDYRKMYAHYYSSPYGFHSKYYPFDWVTVMPDDYMRLFLCFMFVSALFVTLGVRYRMAAAFFFVGISYLFLCDSQHYLNHIYLVAVISFLMIFIPFDRVWSVRAYREGSEPTLPKITLIFLRAFLFIVYAYAGFVKFNEDWLRAEPLRHWVGGKDIPFMRYEATAYLMSYGGLLYDSLVAPMLLWKVTFWPAIFLTLFFHISNKIVFNIGIFPYVMIASTSLFFRADWPHRTLHFLRHRIWKRDGAIYQPIAYTAMKLKFYRPRRVPKLTGWQKLVVLVAAVFLLWWLLMPLRYLYMPGPQVWTEAGHMFSWRMKLRDRDCHADFFGHYPHSHEVFHIRNKLLLGPKARTRIPNRPCMTIQLAHFIADLYTTPEGYRPEIYVYSHCSINYRPVQRYINQTIDLASEPLWDYPTKWLMTMDPLPDELAQQYPWNWEWDSTLWDKLLHDNKPEVQKHSAGRKQRKKDLTQSNREEFKQWIADQYYQGNVTSVNLHGTPSRRDQ